MLSGMASEYIASVGRYLSIGKLARQFQAVGSITSGMTERIFPSAVDVGQLVADSGWQADTFERYCWRCGASAGPSSVQEDGCPACVDRSIAWHRVIRLGRYQPPVSDWITAMKFGKHWPWANFLGRALAERMPRDPTPRPTLVTAVPLHWRRRWLRGFDQADLIAKSLASHAGLPYFRTLKRIQPTSPQSLLHSHSQRWQNVRDKFAPLPMDLSDYCVWLIDDVMTSGATLTQCTRLLKKMGAVEIRLAVAAVTEHRPMDA